LQSSFIEVFVRHKAYLTADSLMLEEFKKKYNFWLEHLARIGKDSIKSLIDMLSVTGGNEQKRTTDYKPLVSTIFRIYNLVLKLKDDSIIDHTEFRQKFLESYEIKLNDAVDCYKDTFKGRPHEKLDSKEILEPTKMRILQKYVEDLSFAGAVMDEIDQRLNENQRSQIHQSNDFLSSLSTIEPYQPVL
jgi:hypothetical protein